MSGYSVCSCVTLLVVYACTCMSACVVLLVAVYVYVLLLLLLLLLLCECVWGCVPCKEFTQLLPKNEEVLSHCIFRKRCKAVGPEGYVYCSHKTYLPQMGFKERKHRPHFTIQPCTCNNYAHVFLCTLGPRTVHVGVHALSGTCTWYSVIPVPLARLLGEGKAWF